MGFIRGNQIEMELKMDSKIEIRIDQGQLNWNVVARGLLNWYAVAQGQLNWNEIDQG